MYNNYNNNYEGDIMIKLLITILKIIKNFFSEINKEIEKENRLQTAIDVVREQFGFLAIQKGTVLTEGSRNIERSKLIGGHSAGGLEGLK